MVPSLIRCAIHYRFEHCVGEPSIGKANPLPFFLHYADYPRGIAVIALSSPHQKKKALQREPGDLWKK